MRRKLNATLTAIAAAAVSMGVTQMAIILMTILATSVLSFAGEVPPSQPAAMSATSDAPRTPHALKISPGDSLDVSVFDTPELSAKLRVDEHGNVTLPLGNVVAVSGMTAEEAGQAIEARLRGANILKDPHVTVTVAEYATQGVTVLGEVKNPGVYPLLGAHGLLDMISAAGGVNPTAGKAVTITHRADPLHPLVEQLDTRPGSTANIAVDIFPGDTIMVSRAGVVYVIGDVGKAGGFIIESNDRLTVLQAVALAQGANRTAALNSTKLIRKTATGREEIKVPLKPLLANKAPDPPLADGDVLFVPSSAKKSFAYRGMEAAIQVSTGIAIYRP